MKKLMPIVLLVIVLAGSGWLLFRVAPDVGNQTKTSNQKDTFNKQARSTEQAQSLWVIVNKKRPLEPRTYVPQDMRVPDVPLRLDNSSPEMRLHADAAEALERLVAAAKADGLEFMLASGYRSYSYQEGLYNHYVRQQGQSAADTQSARPGYSEHQTGLAADLEPTSRKCEIESCFGALPEGQWLAQHAHEYGFIIRYPEGKQAVTGYIYEPWHIRYVGIDLAQEIIKHGRPTLEEFFGLPAANTY